MGGRGRHTAPPRPPVGPPANAKEGAARIRQAVIDMFDRKDGTGANWLLMIESLFMAAFQLVDGRADDEARRSLMRRVHVGAYDRAAGNAGEANPLGGAQADATPSDVAAPSSPGPHPPR